MGEFRDVACDENETEEMEFVYYTGFCEQTKYLITNKYIHKWREKIKKDF